MDFKKVGKFISKLRKDAGLTQEELAEKIKVNSKTISKWETGINVPDTVPLFELSKVFNVSVQDILNGEIVDSKSVNDSTIIEGISFYNKIFKKKIIGISVAVIIFIITIFSVLYTISNYNKNQLYDIKTDNQEYEIDGYLINNNKETIFIINNITYISSDIATDFEPKINKYSISIQEIDSNKSYYSFEKELDKYYTMSEIVDNIKISFASHSNKTNIIKNNKIYLILSYNFKGKIKNVKMKLLFNKHYSNNKIIY